MEVPAVDELGGWIRLEQSDGDYVYVRASLVAAVGESGGADGKYKQFVNLFNGATIIIAEEPREVVEKIRAGVTAERKLQR